MLSTALYGSDALIYLVSFWLIAELLIKFSHSDHFVVISAM